MFDVINDWKQKINEAVAITKQSDVAHYCSGYS
jgi:hypothetical protein